MNLFCKIESERGKPVTKSGNDYIDIEVLNENREVVLDITLQPYGENGLVHALIRQGDITKTLWAGYLGESKPKTDGNITCECGQKFYGLEGKEDTCPKCLEKLIKPKTARELCEKHGSEYMERHKLDGHYICRACVIESLK